MKYGERVTFKADRFDEKGRACGPFSDPQAPSLKPQKLCCARGVIPGETAEAAFAGRDKGRLKLAEVKILEASPDRVAAPCPHAGICGGCSLQHVRYGRQLDAKRDEVNGALEEAGLAMRIDAVRPSVTQFRHRNRMDYVFGPNGELGLKEAGRWDKHLDLTTCLMLSEKAVEVMHRAKAWAATTKHRPWDNRSHQGYLRYLVIREGKSTGERMATLVTAAGDLEKADALAETLSPLCTTVYHGVNPLPTDLSIAKELTLLHGKPLLHEKISGLTYAIHPNSFFQTNSAMAEVLLEHVRGLVKDGPHERLLDLYCGGGFFAVALAKDVDEALGIELDPQNIEMAELNKKENGIANARFRAEAAETLSWSVERPDVVIVDPPRSGLHPKVKRTLLARLPPRVIYVSCNPRALAADLKELLASYDAAEAVAFDLFPQTMHVETVIHLKKKP